MMNYSREDSSLNNKITNKPLTYTSVYFTPAIFCGTLLIILSYIIDLLFAKSTMVNLGETTSAGAVLYSTGSLISKLSFPLISTLISITKGGLLALPSGIIGGLLSISGSTSQNIAGSIAGVSGIFGSIAVGYLCGYTTTLCKKLLQKKEKDTTHDIIIIAASLILTLLGTLAINTISEYVNSVSNRFLVFNGEKQSLFLPLILAVFITTDPGGPLFLSAYIFGASSLATGQSQIMASIVAAGMVPSLSIGLFAYIYKERLEEHERICAYCSTFSSLAGISQLCFPFYVSYTYKFLLPCILGGCVSSALSILFKCKTNLPMGGFLTFSSDGKPFFFLVAIICGVITSTLLLSLTIKKKDTDNTTDEITKPNTSIKTATS